MVLQARNFSISDWNGVAAISHVSFDVHGGEIVGIAGVSGNGQTELVEVISGMNTLDGGELIFKGKSIANTPVGERRDMGIAHIPEDRMDVGLNLQTTLDENLIVSRYNSSEFNRYGFLMRKAIREFTEKIVKAYSIAAAQPGEGISMLSGGNLQKVVVGRELSGNPSLVIANQPTRGLDVGSIEFVHKTLIEERDKGAGVLLISVELDEIMSLADRNPGTLSRQDPGRAGRCHCHRRAGRYPHGGRNPGRLKNRAKRPGRYCPVKDHLWRKIVSEKLWMLCLYH